MRFRFYIEITFIFIFLNLVGFTNIQAQNTYSFGNVKSIVESKCFPCHSDNSNLIPIQCLNDLKKISKTATYVISNNIMPPWPPDNNYSQFNHNRSLNNDEKQILIQWLSSLNTQGELPDEKFINKDTHFKEKPFSAYELKNLKFGANQKDSIYIFEIPINEKDSFDVSSVKFSCSDINWIHHCNFFIQAGNEQKFEFDKLAFAYGYSPGNSFYPFPENCGFKMPAKGFLRGEIHFPPLPIDISISIRFDFWKSKNPIKEKLELLPFSNLKPQGMQTLMIPKDTLITLEGSSILQKSYMIYYVNPHMHLLGKSVEAYAIKPDGTKINLIQIPNWKFNWQDFYQFQNPVFLPEGTQVHLKMTYDNTISNPLNPNNPPRDISEGWYTSQEMFTLLLLGTLK